MNAKVAIISKDEYGFLTYRLLKRVYKGEDAANNEITRRKAALEVEKRGDGVRFALVDADNAVLVQFAAWAEQIIKVNPRYATDPTAIPAYVKTGNWNAPDVCYAHFEDTIRGYGEELRKEFETIRNATAEDGEARMRILICGVGLEPTR